MCKFCENGYDDVVCYLPTDNGGGDDLPQNYCQNCGSPLTEPAPLTLEQLREMDGEPMYVVFKGDEYSEAQSHWCFISGGDVYPCDWQGVQDYTYPLNRFGGADTDLCAYSHKPVNRKDD